MNGFVKDYETNITNHKEFFNGLFGVKQIITYGHSMAKVDWPYFAEIIKIVGINVPWRVSCFSMDDRNNTAEFQKYCCPVKHF